MPQVTIGDYAAATLSLMGKPVTQDNVNKMVAWWHWESGGGNAASFNPADIIMNAMGSTHPDPNGTTPFNTFASGGRVYHVANYPSLASGITQTAFFIMAHPTLSSAFDSGVSYTDGLTRINRFQASFASPSFMQNIQNTSPSQALQWASTPINHGTSSVVATSGADVTVVGGAPYVPPNNATVGAILGTIPRVPGLIFQGVGQAGSSAVSAAGDVVSKVTQPFQDVAGFLSALWSGLTSKETWMRVGMFLGGFVLIIMGLWLFAARSQEIPGPTQTAVLAAKA